MENVSTYTTQCKRFDLTLVSLYFASKETDFLYTFVVIYIILKIVYFGTLSFVPVSLVKCMKHVKDDTVWHT